MCGGHCQRILWSECDWHVVEVSCFRCVGDIAREFYGVSVTGM